MSRENKDDLLSLIRQGKPMTLGQQLRLTVQLSTPAILAQLSATVMQYIDASMVGSLGANQAASIGLVASSTWLFGGLMTACCFGFSVQVAQSIGAKDTQRAKNIFRQSIAASMLFAVILAAIGCLSAGISPVCTSAKPDPRNAWRAAMVTGNRDLAGTEEDAFSSARRILSEGKPIPRIYHAWGSEDFVRTSARTTRDFFLQMPGNPFGYVWQEHPGMHTWEFWDEHIQTFLEFTGLSRVDDVKN